MLKFLESLLAALHVAQTVDRYRLANDPAYREQILAQLGGKPVEAAPSNDNSKADLQKAA